MSKEIDHQLRKLSDRDSAIGVIGLGYVGLPLALAFASERFSVTGFDIDAEKEQRITAGESYFVHIPNEQIERVVDSGHLSATTDFSRLSEMDVIIICVPTPLSPDLGPDLQFVENTAHAVAKTLRRGQLIILESTTYPGTTREVLVPILQTSGLMSGSDFFVAYSPEREDPGSFGHSTQSIPKIVGADGADALKLTTALYDYIVPQTIPVSSVDVAEAAKLTENIFRAVNIALVNELKLVFEQLDIDVWEVIDAAKTKPFGFMPFYPGPGLGGHCIPIDPFYLSWRARQVGMETQFVELAGQINTAMPDHVVDVLKRALSSRGGNIAECRVLLFGIAYKKNVDDVRESPAFRLMDLLEAAGAQVAYHDPFVEEIPMTREYSQFAGRRSVDLDEKTLAEFGAALICTDHDGIDYAHVVEHSELVIDTRNATKDVESHRDRIVKA